MVDCAKIRILNRAVPHADGGVRWQAASMYWDHMTGCGLGNDGLLVGDLDRTARARGLGIATWARATTPTSRQETQQADSARHVLDDRLARGDIDVEEYERRRTAMDHDFSAATRT